ncbi:hypothetical protein [Hymenobacter elongatus]|uniref:Sigma-70 family RNA polymerase sigma factor n=1 Tax=Hymenobacter elongatus TaxID=877208 RepID=A0A4Z0PKR9_9BACT|nr:hypothetical protein [Hymenobacter elongatus]TGE15054.1 hypothetical protein E5J99_13530 [Hymenobacter elongatus]
MNQPLAEALTHLRMGNQTFLINFYQDHRDHFARWARRHHQLELASAHEALRAVLIDFYDQVIDGRLTKLPPDLRAYLYGMGREQIETVKTTAALPVVEASRRQHLLGVFGQMGNDCQQVLMYFYFRGYNFEKVAGKMGFANATVARLQKASCLRKLIELRGRAADGALPGAAAAPPAV